MTKATDIRVVDAELYFLPVETRVPLKFGPETTTSVTCARVKITVADRGGRTAEGWGETPLSVQWVWPSKLPYAERHQVLKDFTVLLAEAWRKFEGRGHPIELGWDFQEQVLRTMLGAQNRSGTALAEPMPWLAALVCCSLFDIAIHDAYGNLHGRPVYQTYNAEFLNRDLSEFLAPAVDSAVSFRGRYPADFLVPQPATQLRAWHLVGGLDLLDPNELNGTEPKDGYPVLLGDWIDRDGLKCLKIKLRGNDPEWDYQRLLKVGAIAVNKAVEWLTADFNCTVTDPAYVTEHARPPEGRASSFLWNAALRGTAIPVRIGRTSDRCPQRLRAQAVVPR